MSEFLVIQVGQCGNQIGFPLWSSILDEYNINPGVNEKRNNPNSKYESEVEESLSSFLNISCKADVLHSGKVDLSQVKARVICIDMEDRVISRFSNSNMSFLFDKKSLITNHPGSGNNWAVGYYTHGRKFRNKILRAITKYVEKSDKLHGILLMYSLGGGTGSGLGSYILELLEDHFSHIDRFVTCVYPTGCEDVITAPLNMALGTQYLISHATCVFPVENRALQEISSREKIIDRFKVDSFTSIADTFRDMNSIVVKSILHLTSGSRFSGQLNMDMNEIETNMVPFPRMKFLASSFSPIGNGSLKMSSRGLKEDNFWNICNKNNQLLKINPMDQNSVLLSGMLLGRGEYSLSDMRKFVDKFQKTSPSSEWSKKCVKTGLCKVPIYDSQYSIMGLFNSSSINALFTSVSSGFDKLLRKKAHIHHYTEVPGFDYDNFFECQNSLADIIDIYEEIGLKSDKIPRLQPRIQF